MFLFIDSSLRNRAREKKITGNNADDVVQSAILEILLLMQKFNSDEISRDELLDGVETIYQNLKLGKEDFFYQFKSISIDKPILSEGKTLQELIPDDYEHRIGYLNKADESDRQKLKVDVQKVLDGVSLTKREQETLSLKYSNDEVLKYTKMSKINGRSVTANKIVTMRAIKKIQSANDSLPEDDVKKIDEVVSRFKDEGLTYEDYLSACLRFSQLFSMTANTIESNVRELVEKFENEGLTAKKYISACLRRPSLFAQSPDTIENNVREVVKKFSKDGLTTDAYLNTCLAFPQLFCSKQLKIEKRFQTVLFMQRNLHKDMSQDDIIKKVLSSPILLTCNHERSYDMLLMRKMIARRLPHELAGKDKVHEKLVNYLKANPNVSYHFSVINDELTDDFIKYAKNLAIEALGRDDVFDITVE